MKSNPAVPGGLLTSKPTWSNTPRVFRHVGFFSIAVGRSQTTREESYGKVQFDHGATDRRSGKRFRGAANGPRAQIGERGPKRSHVGDHAPRGFVAGREGPGQ